MISKLKFIFFLILGLLILNWVYKFFAGPESINLILENKFKLFFLVFAHIPTFYFDSLTWVVFMTKKKTVFSECFYYHMDCPNFWKIFPNWQYYWRICKNLSCKEKWSRNFRGFIYCPCRPFYCYSYIVYYRTT